jgi:hypothetical protein
MKSAKKKLKRKGRSEKFQIAYETRNLEINLFWKRYGAFWIIVAAAFVGFAELKASENDYSILLASFGFISSFAWTLMNRGSKYWQETWEDRAGRNDATGFFQRWEPIQKKNFWSARRYSVSKLAIVLSDFVALCWLIILGNDTYSLIYCRWDKAGFIIISSLFITLVFLFILLFKGRSTVRVIEKHNGIHFRLELKGDKYYLSYYKNKELEEKVFDNIDDVKKIKNDFPFIEDMLKKLPNDKEQI